MLRARSSATGACASTAANFDQAVSLSGSNPLSAQGCHDPRACADGSTAANPDHPPRNVESGLEHHAVLEIGRQIGNVLIAERIHQRRRRCATHATQQTGDQL